MSGTQITALPDNLSVGGSLDLEGTQITALPDNLSVSGSLNLSGTQITSKASWIISGNIGSRNTKTSYQKSTGKIRCGCFIGSLSEFAEKVEISYPDKTHKHRIEYDAFIEHIKKEIV